MMDHACSLMYFDPFVQVGDIGELDRDQIRDHQKQQEHDPASFSSMGSRSELDHFMVEF